MQTRRDERLEFVRTLLAADKASTSPQLHHGAIAASLLEMLQHEVIYDYIDDEGEEGRSEERNRSN